MDDTQTLKIIFTIYFILWTVVSWTIAFRFFYKYLVMEKRCKVETVGIVKKYESFSRGHGVRLPVVYYEVNGVEHRTTGPGYKFYKTTKIKRPLEIETDQKYTTDIHAQVFEQKLTGSGMIIGNPMAKLFPKGSTIPVFYDPNNPQLSYVLRYVNQKWLFWVLFAVGLLALIGIVLLHMYL